MPGELPQKISHLRTSNTLLGMTPEVQGDPIPLRPNAQSGQDRDPLMVSHMRWYNTGVWPIGDQLRRTSGAISRPLSSTNTRKALNREAFFLCEANHA